MSNKKKSSRIFQIRHKTTGQVKQVIGITLYDALDVVGWQRPEIDLLKVQQFKRQRSNQKWG